MGNVGVDMMSILSHPAPGYKPAPAVADAGSADARVQGVRAFFDMLAATPGLTATALQTVGSKGWDGFAIALVG
jgi:predicted O-methyltransferase YrrM